MSTSAGPNIVEDGLVLSLDAANEKSFRGEPTTNLLTNPTPTSTTGYTALGGTGSVTYDSTTSSIFWQRSTYEAWGAFLKNNTLFNGSLSILSYTASFEWKESGTISHASTWFEIVEDGDTNPVVKVNMLANSTYLSDGFYRFSYTFTPANTGINAYFRVWNPATTGTTAFYWRNLQLEQKGYRTPFVSGARGTTVATGGGWADLSSSSNHGTISGSPLYSYPNNGGILIDSADDYFDLASPSSLPAGSSDRTIISFVKTPSSLSGFQHVFHYGTAAQDKSFGLALYAGKLSTHPWVGTPTSDATLQPSTIYGLAVAYRQSDSKHLFWINGIKDSSEPVRAINTGSTTARVGSRISTAVEGWIPNGQIYNVFIYNRVLSDSEIAQNFNALRGRYGI